MLAFFARKEYQTEAGNLSHTHFLGKLHHMDEKAKNMLLDLIRNNVVDIIKPEEINNLLNEGYISHVDDVNEVRNDG